MSFVDTYDCKYRKKVDHQSVNIVHINCCSTIVSFLYNKMPEVGSGDNKELVFNILCNIVCDKYYF